MIPLQYTMTPILKSRLQADIALIEQGLKSALTAPTGTTPAEQRLYHAMAYSCLNGGKRLRPFLVLQTARLLGVGEQSPQWDGVVACAVALEMVHCYSLVHDDLPCMDDDELRRGNPTTHIQYDEHTAVLAGDALLTHAFTIIAHAPIPAENRIAVVAELANCAGIMGMVGGQMIDLRANTDNPDSNGIARLQRLKTGRLIDAGCAMACHAVGATEGQRMALLGYTENLGLAFQITDDILDVTSTADHMGKAVGKDAQAGKATFVGTLGLDGATALAQNHIATAQNVLNDPALNTGITGFDSARQVLYDLANYVLTRQN